MPRIPTVTPDTGDAGQRQLLSATAKAMGRVPNLIATMVHSVAATQAYMAFSQALSKGVLDGAAREQIALATAQLNTCGYCLAAHSAIGAGAGLDATQIELARRGRATDPHIDAILALARRIVETRGRIDAADVEAARVAGVTDAELVEIVANVALNVFTNYFNHLAATEVDFPEAPAIAA